MVWLEYEALPWTLWLIERPVLPYGVPIISDYDDAVFHRYDKHRSGAVRALPGQKIRRVMAASDFAMSGNANLGDHARRSGRRDWAYKLWIILMLQAWRERRQ